VQAPAGFVLVADPDKPGDYLVMAKGQFDPAKHRLFEEPAAAAPDPTPAAPEKAAEPMRKGRGR